MSREDWSLDIFSVIGMVVTGLCAYNSGKKDGYKQKDDQMRDQELEQLRREVAELKAISIKEIL